MNVDIKKIDLTNTNQKIFAGALLAALLFFLYWALPPLVFILKNLWLTVLYGGGLVFLALNWLNIWNLFKQVSWGITKGMISGDKLGYMYRYHEYLVGKTTSLEKSIQNVSAMRLKLQRKVGDLNKTIEDNKKLHISYTKQNSPDTVLRTLQNRINVDTDLKDKYIPRVVYTEKQENSLKELHDYWVSGAEDLKYTLDAKAEEYKLLKELNQATDSASAFLDKDNAEYKIYQESLKQIEDSVTQYAANIENFEKKVQPIIQGLAMNRETSEDMGLQLIEEYKAQQVSLKLPEGKS